MYPSCPGEHLNDIKMIHRLFGSFCWPKEKRAFFYCMVSLSQFILGFKQVFNDSFSFLQPTLILREFMHLYHLWGMVSKEKIRRCLWKAHSYSNLFIRSLLVRIVLQPLEVNRSLSAYVSLSYQ